MSENEHRTKTIELPSTITIRESGELHPIQPH